MCLPAQQVSRSASVAEVSAFYIPIVFSVKIYDEMRKVSDSRQKGLSRRLISEMFTEIKAFQYMIRLWKFQLRSNNSAQFSVLRTKNPTVNKNMYNLGSLIRI